MPEITYPPELLPTPDDDDVAIVIDGIAYSAAEAERLFLRNEADTAN